MQTVVVVGRNIERGPLSCRRYAELLSARLGVEARHSRLNPAKADTIVWLRFSVRPLLSDWLAGWLDWLLHGREAGYRAALRARLTDVLRALFRSLPTAAELDAMQFALLHPQRRVIQLTSPDQAWFWLQMQEERMRLQTPACRRGRSGFSTTHSYR